MMYQNKLAVAVKSNRKVLREFGDTIYLPFGSEFSLLIKNLNTVRSIVNITIDGKEVVKGGLIVNANSEVDLERFVGENMNQGNRFKFIERNDAVEAHRGVKLEDGIIRVEYQFEKVFQTYYRPPYYTYTATTWPYDIYCGSGVSHSTSETLSTSSSVLRSGMSSSSTPTAAINYSSNDAGITVPGSVSDQKFSKSYGFQTESEKHVMVFKLLGETVDNKAVRQAVTVKHKQKCSSCGKNNKAHAKFCYSCGTALQVIA
jgi:hypothetical protein